ncbi:MAG: potassium/proton antiporter [Pseudomonadota bacterium]
MTLDQANLFILIGGALLLFSVFASLVSARFGTPLLLVFLIVGMLAGEDGPGGIHFDNAPVAFLIGTVALVIILFDGGMRTDSRRLRVALGPASVLATVGVLITCVLVGAAARYAFNLSWAEGLLLGAIVSSTDAAAVFSIFQSQRMQLKDRVASTLEIESGSNDPMAVMLTIALLSMLAAPNEWPWWRMLLLLLQQFALGLLGGWLGGRLLVLACKHVRLNITFFPILALAASAVIYAGTAAVGGSGFLAIYLAGFLLGQAKLPAMVHILRVQDGLTWLSQIIMFLILGLLVTPSELLPLLLPTLLIAAVLMFVARPLAVWLSLLPFRFPWRDQVFIGWVGLRGAVPIILALFPLLAGEPNAKLFLNVAFVIVLLSLVIQGWSIAPLARLLRLELPAQPEPQFRMPIESPTHDQLWEVASFRIGHDTPALAHSVDELILPTAVRVAGVFRGDSWHDPVLIDELKIGDVVYVVAESSLIPQASRVLGDAVATPRLSADHYFGERIVRASMPMTELARSLGFALAANLAGKTVGQFIEGTFRGRAVVGDSVTVGHVRLVVCRVLHGHVSRVGIHGEPRPLPRADIEPVQT